MENENLESKLSAVKSCMPNPMPYTPCMGPVILNAIEPAPADGRYEDPPESNSTYEETSPETSAYDVSPFSGILRSLFG